MASIGETLRRERQRRKLNLDQVSRELKIARKFLEAIEKENFDVLPAGVLPRASCASMRACWGSMKRKPPTKCSARLRRLPRPRNSPLLRRLK